MPNCPDCGTELGIWEWGTVCPTCMRLFSFIESRALPGYDREIVESAFRLYKIMFAAGLLERGCNKVTFGDDAMIIEREIDRS